MGKATHARRTRAAGTPSATLDGLQELGESARLGYRLSQDKQLSPTFRYLMTRLSKCRADAYDAALDKSLGYVGLIREGYGERAASVVELRFVDGLGWAEVCREVGTSTGTAYSLAQSALDWLDRAHTPHTTAPPARPAWAHEAHVEAVRNRYQLSASRAVW